MRPHFPFLFHQRCQGDNMTYKSFDATRAKIYNQLQVIISSVIGIQVKQQRQSIHLKKILEMRITSKNGW